MTSANRCDREEFQDLRAAPSDKGRQVAFNISELSFGACAHLPWQVTAIEATRG